MEKQVRRTSEEFRRRQWKFALQMFLGACWGVIVGRFLISDHPVFAMLVSVFGAILIWCVVNREFLLTNWRLPTEEDIDREIERRREERSK